ncbi:MAG TPA: fatty acid desaturase [Polyangiaceae bacterium]
MVCVEVTPRTVDARFAASGTNLASLRAALPKEVFVLDATLAWLGLARAFACIAVGELLLSSIDLEWNVSLVWRGAAVFASWWVVAAGMVGLFVIGHDCGHGSFSNHRRVNTIVGHLCMSGILTGFHNWRIAHDHHHAHSQIRAEDTDWPEGMLTHEEYSRAGKSERLRVELAFGSPIGLLVGFLVGMVRRTLMRWLYPQVKLSPRRRRELLLSTALMVLTSGGIASALYVHGGWGCAVKYYGAPLYFGMILGAFFTYLHHSSEGALVFDRRAWTPIRGQVVSTFDVRFPAWFELLFFHINRHPPHHVAPRVPWYHLPRAMDALRAVHPDVDLERRFSIAYLRRAWAAPLLSPVADGVYVMQTVADDRAI